MDPRLVSNVLQQLRMRNAAEGAFRGITADYQALLQQCMELAVRPHVVLVERGWHAAWAWELWRSPLPWCRASYFTCKLVSRRLCPLSHAQWLLVTLAGAKRAAREGGARAAGRELESAGRR